LSQLRLHIENMGRDPKLHESVSDDENEDERHSYEIIKTDDSEIEEEEEENEEEDNNDDYCSSCRLGGKLLCCESCTRSFHLICLNPPRLYIPSGDWFCNTCKSKKKVEIDVNLTPTKQQQQAQIQPPHPFFYSSV